ncbi:O-antigen ligase family protein [Streptacidiphilus rugosus]|uniref:O-antigen ligase family protein n=1 Tax=Streptacidiphilus rugosus TaxID=405783 RepID=UPI00068C8224|nr:hypothetical protein [Streptacidiphilus rugosus]
MSDDTAVPSRDGARCDMVGLLLLAACAAWTVLSAEGRQARPEGVLLGLLAVTTGYAMGRIAGASLPVTGLLAPAVGVAVFVPAFGRPVLGEDAQAALLALSVGAACCAGYSATGRVLPRACGALALVLAAESLLTYSLVGALACGGTLLVAGSVHRTHGRARASALLAICALAAVGTTVVLARTGAGGAPVPADRLTLWREALTDLGEQPLRGVGPGDFGSGNASSAALQAAAEQGWPGVALLGCAFAWTLWALARSPRPTPAALSAAGALTSLAVLASVTPVLGAPAVAVGAGLLLGLGAARP